MAFLTMELLAGETLSFYLKRKGPLTPAEAMPLIRQMVEGLQALHDANIVDRDFKPGNVILVRDSALGRDGEPKTALVEKEPAAGQMRVVITDFGLARNLTPEGRDALADQAALSRSGQIFGTPGYMAPEQFAGRTAGLATDVFALGVVIHEIVHGTKPFADGDVWNDAARLPGNQPPEVLGAWQPVIRKCLERNPGDRSQSAVEVLALLEAKAVAAEPVTGESKRRDNVGGLGPPAGS